MSSNPFGNLSTQNTEAVEDRLGGGNFEAIPTDIYTGKIKVAYAGESSGGARSLTIIATGGDFGEREYRETIYLTSGRDKGQKNTYDKDGKTYQLPGFIIANHLAQCTVGKQIMELQFEDKMVNIYDPDLKKEAPKSVPVAIELIGQEVSFAIIREVRTAQEKVNGQYQDKADGSTRTSNVIEKVFNSAYKMTVHEAEAKQKDANFVADFWDKWIERNKDKDRDRTSKNGNAGQAGRPGQSAGGAPTGSQGGGDAPRKSLFGGN